MLAAAIALAAALPPVLLAVRAFSADPAIALAALWRPRTIELALSTVGVTVATSLVCLVVGVAQAWALTAVIRRRRRLWIVLACLPLAVPSLVSAFALTTTIVPGAHGIPALVLVLALGTLPYVTIPTLAAFARADIALVDVAQTLGRRPLAAVLTVGVPQVLPAALAGTLLVALYTLSDFGAPALLRVDTLTTGIYAQFRSSFDRAAPAALALPLVLLALVCVVGESRARGSSAPADAARFAASPRSTPSAGAVRIATGLLAALAIVSVGVPLAALVLRLAEGSRYGADAAELVAAAATTAALGGATAVGAATAALPIAWLAARSRTRAVAAVEGVSMIGHALPGLIVALALVAMAVGQLRWAYQTPVLLVAAYVVVFLPKAIGASRAAIEGVPRALEDVSSTLGASPWRTGWHVTLSGALPGIVAGAVLVASATMRELPATLMLRPIGMETLATQLWSKTSIGAYGAAAVPALLLVAVGVLPALIMAKTAVPIGVRAERRMR